MEWRARMAANCPFETTLHRIGTIAPAKNRYLASRRHALAVLAKSPAICDPFNHVRCPSPGSQPRPACCRLLVHRGHSRGVRRTGYPNQSDSHGRSLGEYRPTQCNRRRLSNPARLPAWAAITRPLLAVLVRHLFCNGDVDHPRPRSAVSSDGPGSCQQNSGPWRDRRGCARQFIVERGRCSIRA